MAKIGEIASVLHSYVPATADERTVRMLLASRDETRYRVYLQTWSPNVRAAHDLARRLWLTLDDGDVRWEASVTEHRPGVYDGDDWFMVTVSTGYGWGEAGARDIAERVHESRARWLPVEASPRTPTPGEHVVLVARDIALVQCLHCDDLFAATVAWRRCECERVSARMFSVGEPKQRALQVKVTDGARFAALEARSSDFDGLKAGGSVQLRCTRKLTSEEE